LDFIGIDILGFDFELEANGGGGIRTPSDASDKSLQNRNKNHTKLTQDPAKSDTYKNGKTADFDKNHTCS
jgi:hypothetical protein